MVLTQVKSKNIYCTAPNTVLWLVNYREQGARNYGHCDGRQFIMINYSFFFIFFQKIGVAAAGAVGFVRQKITVLVVLLWIIIERLFVEYIVCLVLSRNSSACILRIWFNVSNKLLKLVICVFVSFNEHS